MLSVNIAISHILLKTKFFGLHFCRRHYRSIVNHFEAIGLQSYTEFSEITQNKDYYAVQGHSRSPILEPVESPYATFYLVINANVLLQLTRLIDGHFAHD